VKARSQEQCHDMMVIMRDGRKDVIAIGFYHYCLLYIEKKIIKEMINYSNQRKNSTVYVMPKSGEKSLN
jgi:hypothetical protein